MRKKDKKTLRAVLRLLYFSANYFKIKKDGTVIIKKSAFSLRSVRTTVREIIQNTIVETMSKLDKVAAEQYSKALYNLDPEDISAAIEVAFEHFITFKEEESFNGVMLDFDIVPSKMSRVLLNVREFKKDFLQHVKGRVFDFNLKEYLLKKKKLEEEKPLKAKVSENVKTLQDTIAETVKTYEAGLSRCFIGKKEYDDKFLRVERILEYRFAI